MHTINNKTGFLKEQHACDQVKKLSIDTALQRNWTIPHRHIDVHVLANQVTLTGTVYTKHACHEAEKIAIQTPGVFSVCNNIVVTQAND